MTENLRVFIIVSVVVAISIVSIGLVVFVYDYNEKNSWFEPTSELDDNTLKQKLAEKTTTSGYDILPIYDDSMYDAVFSGDIADKICNFIEIPCPIEPKFKGNYDFTDKSGGFMFVDREHTYLFSITGVDNQILVKLKDDRFFVPLPEYVTKTIPNKEIEMFLDKQNYEPGDSIKISGVAYDYRNNHIIVNVFDPNFQLMAAAKIEVDTLGRFSHSFDSYSSWKLGTYKIQIYDDEIKFEHSFEITSSHHK